MNYKDINDYEILYLIEEKNENAYSYFCDKYRPLINKFAKALYKKYKYFGIEYEDLLQEGLYGLSEAIRQYNSYNSSTFYTLALVCIKREMQRIVIKFGRNKNLILTNSVSIDMDLGGSDFTLADSIFSEDDLLEEGYIRIYENKRNLDLKYSLKDKHAQVYELKFNGFSNQDISILLDIKYKDVDNYLRSIKLKLRKLKMNVEY